MSYPPRLPQTQAAYNERSIFNSSLSLRRRLVSTAAISTGRSGTDSSGDDVAEVWSFLMRDFDEDHSFLLDYYNSQVPELQTHRGVDQQTHGLPPQHSSKVSLYWLEPFSLANLNLRKTNPSGSLAGAIESAVEWDLSIKHVAVL